MTKDVFIKEVRDAEAMLYHISKSILKNDSDCGDAVQETILKAYEKLPTLKKEKYFRTWITRILINECKGILRKRKNVIPYEEYMDNMKMTEEDRYSHLYMAIMELPEDLRVLVTLYYFEGAVIRRREKTGNWEKQQAIKKNNRKGENVMLENKWNNIAPEVPQDFHNKFEDTLKQIEQADSVDKKYKRKKISGRLLIAAAVICTGMAVTVAAKEFFKWNNYLVKRLEPSEEQQKTLQESPYIQNIDQSVTQNGVTVTLTDSIQDQGFLYAFFEVKTDDSISMTDHTSFEEMTHFKIDGKEVYAVDDNRFGSFNTGVGQDVLLKTDQNSTHLKYFNACISYDGDYDLSNKTVEITLKNLTEEGDYDTTVITDGTWDFKWTLGAVKPPTTLEVNRKCDFGGYEITVKKMEVTPLLWSLYLDYDEAMKVYEDEKNKFEYAGTDYGMDLYVRTSIDQVRYKDGTVLTLDRTMGGIAGGGEKQDKENGVMIIRNSFPQLVDVDNLQAVHFGNIDQWLEVRG